VRILSLPFLHPLRDLGLLSLRLGIGVVLAVHGWAKWLSGPGGWVSGKVLADLGLPSPEILAWLVLVVELVGGVLIVLGFLTRIFGIGGLVLFLVALLKLGSLDFVTALPSAAHVPAWSSEGYWVMFFGCLALAFTGPGILSLDALFGLERDRR
jgi:putative oxidoreductase